MVSNIFRIGDIANIFKNFKISYNTRKKDFKDIIFYQCDLSYPKYWESDTCI